MVSPRTPRVRSPAEKRPANTVGQCANTQRTTAVTEAFPAITFVNSRRVGVVPSPDEI